MLKMRICVYTKRHSSQRVRRLATSVAVPSLGGTEASRGFERPSSSSAKSSLPRVMHCQHCAVAAIMRKRRLEGMRSKVLAGGRRIRRQLQLEEFNECTRNGCSSAVLGASHTSGSCRRAEGLDDDIAHGWRPWWESSR